MTQNNEITTKRQQIRAEIKSGKYKSLAGIILDGMGQLIQMVTFSKKPPLFWYTSVVFVLFTLFICILITVPFGDSLLNVAPEIRLNLILLMFSLVLIGSLILIVSATTHNRLLTTLGDNVLDAVATEDNLNSLRGWLATSFNMKTQVLISLLPALVIFPLVGILFAAVTGINFGLPMYIVAIIAGFQVYVILPVLVASFTMPHRLANYQLQVFSVDPSNSEVIDHLSDSINSILLIVGVLTALFSIVVIVFTPTEIFGFVYTLLPAWATLIIVFVSGHYALAKIIHRAKWKTLNSIQAQIETLQEQEEILTEKTLDHIKKLLDHHSQIRTTRNSALDIRAGLSLLQSLLLPLIGVFLANILDVLEILSRFTTGK